MTATPGGHPTAGHRTGGDALVAQLVEHGVRVVFGVPGESYLPVLEALRNQPAVRYVTCRHEGAAAFMADAAGKFTGEPGICLVSRGPGAFHAANGLHMAAQDSTPLILLVGETSRRVREREAFQELDVRAAFGQVAKWAAVVDDPDRVPELMARAFAVATAGRPGPVVLGLPEDVLSAVTDAPVVPPFERGRTTPTAATLERVRALVEVSQRPLVLAGGAAWTAQASAALGAFAERAALPVATVFRYQDAIDNELSCYAGDAGIGANPALLDRIRRADLLLAVGPRLGDVTTGGYSRLVPPVPAQALVHVHAGAEEIGRVYRPTLGLTCAPTEFALALCDLPPNPTLARLEWRDAARQSYLEWRAVPSEREAALDLRSVISDVRRLVPPDAIITNGAGNYTTWLHRYMSFTQYRSQLAPTGGSMGYGLPAAIAAKALAPERTVVAFAGDGCFLMTAQELATAVQEHLPVVTIVVNNAMLGTIRLHQETRYPGHPYATDLRPPDFAALAKAYGAYGEVVKDTAEFPHAFGRALASGQPAVLELRVDPSRLTPSRHLAELSHQYSP